MTWSQSYRLFGEGLGVSALIAASPILTLLVLLGVLRKPAWIAGLCGLAVTFALALWGYGMPVVPAVSATGLGAAFGLFPITWIIFWAIALFRVTSEMGKFAIIRDSIGRLTPDPRLQALLIAFAFGAFLEGAAGFGTPVAIAATMLTGLGFTAFRAAALCLLANTAPVAFGSIGIPVVTLAVTTGLPLNKLSAAVGSLCAPVSVFIPAYLIFATWGLRGLSGIWVPTLAAGAVFASVQFGVSNFVGPQLTDILASLSTIAVLVVVLRYSKPALGNWKLDDSEAGVIGGVVAIENQGIDVNEGSPSVGQVLLSWMPYALLVVCVLLWGFKPIQSLLNSVTVAIHWPYLDDVVVRMPPIVANPEKYHAVFLLNWLSAAGTSCMAATLLAALFLGMSPRRFAVMLVSVVRTLVLPTVTVTCVLGMAFLMNYSGATATLGLAFSATGVMFPLFSSLLGWVGVFLTGSDTSANALFGNLQVVTANRLGFDPVLMAASNSVGGVMGKMISLQTIAVAAAATKMSTTDQSRLFRFTLKHSLLLAAVVGGLSLFYSYGLHLRW